MKKLFKHTFIYAFGTQLSRVVSIFILPFVTPYLTNEDYGINGIALAYLGSFSALKDLGMIAVISNTFYRYPFRFKFIWNRVFSFLSVWSIPLAIIIGIVLFFVLPASTINKIIIILCSILPIIFFDNLILFSSRYLQLSEKPTSFVIISFVSSITSILVSYIAIVHFKLGYKGWFIGSFISQFVAFICYLKVAVSYKIVKFNFNFSLKWIGKYLKISLPAIPHAYSSFLMETSDRIILSLFMININIIGLYNIGYTFGQYFNILNIGLALATSSFYLKLYNNNNKANEIKVRNITFVIWLSILILASIAGLWMKEIFAILIRNQNLKEGFSITIVILFCYVGNVFYMSSGNKLIALGKMNDLWKVSLMAGLINVVLNLILIPYLNVWGSVIATLIGNSYLHFRIFFLKVYKENSYGTNFYPLISFLIIVFVLLSVFLLRNANLYIKISITFFSSLSIVTFLWKSGKFYFNNLNFNS